MPPAFYAALLEGGTFRSEEHATAFCDLRAVLSSATKQGRDLIDTIVELLQTPLGDAACARVTTAE